MRKLIAVLIAAPLLMVGLGAPSALAGGGGGGGVAAGGAGIKGTGHEIQGGRAMWIDVFITCPKGTTWAVTGGGAVFEPLPGVGGTFQGLLSAEETKPKKCQGRTTAEKIRYTMFDIVPITLRDTFPCTLAYTLDLTFRLGTSTSTLEINYAPASDSNGPEVCLDGGTGAFPSPSPSPSPMP